MRLEIGRAHVVVLLSLAVLGVAAPCAADTFTVDSTNDTPDFNTSDGDCDADPDPGNDECTLRAAIQQANADAGHDTIRFNISPAGPKTITPVSQLPSLNTSMTIDGTTQPGFAGTPIIEINGSTPGNNSGLAIHALNCTIRGLVINRLATASNLAAIVFGVGSGSSVVEGCYIGTNISGTAALSNIGSGIILGASNNRIGGTTPSQRNVISGNLQTAISLNGSNNLVQGNFIGTNAAGTSALGNGAGIGGIGSNNLIGGVIGVTPGGPCTGACNLISASTGSSGIRFSGATATGNVVFGNFIGTDVTGNLDLGHSIAGVNLTSGASNNLIGGTLPEERNLISGNTSAGVFLSGAATTGNNIRGNFIGTKIDGTTALPNTLGGIFIDGAAHDNFVGGTTAGAGNVISGNVFNGITIQGASANNRVEGNSIGTDLIGLEVIPNAGHGVFVNNSADTVIGGTVAGAGNHIAHNGGDGVAVFGTAIRTAIRRNLIHDNTGLGIDLSNNGPTVNDVGDADVGPNDLINFPEGIVSSYAAATDETTIRGRVDTLSPTSIAIEIFENTAHDPSKYGEGLSYLDTVIPNAEGAFCLTRPGQLAIGNLTATATNAAGSTSEFSKKTEVQLRALEVVQVVQDLNNTVKLIESKPTYVRGFVETVDTSSPPIPVELRLRGFRNAVELPDSPVTPLNFAGFEAKPIVIGSRFDWSATANFRLPQSWLDGDVELRLERSDNEPLACLEPGDLGGPADPCSDCRARVTFVQTDIPRFRFVAISWTAPESGVEFLFTFPDLEKISRIVETKFPINFVDLAMGAMPWPGPPDPLSVMSAMTAFWVLDLFPNRVYYGAIPGGSRYALAGVARAVPSSSASGYMPTSFSGLGRSTSAHEIGHTLGRDHSADPAKFGVTPEGWSRGPCLEQAWNPPLSGVFPHYFSGGQTSPAAIAGETRMPRLGAFGGDRFDEVFGLNTFPDPPQVVDPLGMFDLMSYCVMLGGLDKWISQHTYEGLQTHIHDRFALWSGKKAVSGGPQSYLIVRGGVALRTGAVTIEPFFHVTTTIAPPAQPTGPYTLRLLDSTDALIADIPFEPTKMEPEGADPQLASFLIPVPDNPAIRKVVVLLGTLPLATRAASANPPTVQVISPNGGETLSSDPVALSWTGTDPDGDPLLYYVQFSPDGGTTWETLLVEHPSQTASIPRSNLKGTANGLIRVMATDGFHTAQDQSNAPFSVANHAPFVSLWRPTQGEMFAGVQQMVFEATGRDVEDGALPGGSLQWTSNVDGALGSGRTLLKRANQLSPGTHTITVTGTDTATATGFASVSIQIGAAAPPTFADLSLEQSSSPVPPIAGNNLTFTLRVTNKGKDTATGVTVTDTLPAGVVFVSANATQGSCGEAGGVVTCTLGNLADEAIATVTVVVTPPTAGLITNSASVSAGEVDPTPANNSSMSDTLVETRGIADLSMEKTDSNDPVPLGGALMYTLQVTNLGGNTAKLVTVTDTLPAGVAYVASSGADWTCGFASGTVTCTRPSLGIGAAPPITIAVTAPSTPGSITNTASVSFADPDSASGNNSESETTQVGGVGPAPANFHTLIPCRIADTRDPDGPFGGPALAAGLQRTFTVAGRCGIPVTAKAVSFNVTITGPTSLGHISLYPGGTALPLVSTMNFSPGQTRANNAIIPMGAGGMLAVTSGQGSGTVHFILDTNGYFE